MHIYSGNVKTSLREDETIIASLIEAFFRNPDPEQRKCLNRAVRFFVDRNCELKSKMWADLDHVLEQIGVRLEVYPDGSDNGSWYRIPASSRTYKGQTQDDRLKARAARRLAAWHRGWSDRGVTEDQIDPITSGDGEHLVSPEKQDIRVFLEAVCLGEKGFTHIAPTPLHEMYKLIQICNDAWYLGRNKFLEIVRDILIEDGRFAHIFWKPGCHMRTANGGLRGGVTMIVRAVPFHCESLRGIPQAAWV